MGITKVGLIVRLLAMMLACCVVGYFKFENHRLSRDLLAVNQQLGGANQRETQLLNRNAAMKSTVHQLKQAAHQARLATMQVDQVRQHWQRIAQRAKAQIHKALAHENCAHQFIPHASEWLYYSHSNQVSYSVSH
ncbi:MAG: hypothetical protein CENE_03812 [Candidatus Celerinatantimonas neptuna]|nr:MAG: hypothetical protein CENE_03812 [Candidatus Celerinatantimonas neptuna]